MFGASVVWLAAAVAAIQQLAPPTYVTGLETQALIEQLNGELLASRSATLTLEHWCAEHHMAQKPKLTAQRDVTTVKAASAETRAHLQVGPDEPLGYRRVRLTCGDHVMSEADNWYVPARLTPEMNRLLEETDTPFGRAILALGVHRQTIAVDRLWSPLAPNWADAPVSAKVVAKPADGALFRHRAVLLTPTGQPVSEVAETYLADSLDFPRHTGEAPPR